MSLRAVFLVSFATVIALHVALFYVWPLVSGHLDSEATFYTVPVVAAVIGWLRVKTVKRGLLVALGAMTATAIAYGVLFLLFLQADFS